MNDKKIIYLQRQLTIKINIKCVSGLPRDETCEPQQPYSTMGEGWAVNHFGLGIYNDY